MNTRIVVLVECTEPMCESYGIGHKQTDFGDDLDAPMHYRPEMGNGNWRVTVSRFDDMPTWSVGVEANDQLSAIEAVQLAADVQAAAADCERLNSRI
ncbi:hypothetical protein G3T36_10625 [Diaminobutyricibacter tongyongensis]|uniref:Uncharacterized protein n=1 Tax=Leifsonia tongyongensis TaxID=1268043 RepID=A0A6L9XY22_9MICO|nr:hypothetical protein [Diaminobutyricibacter tongyongensis]NEN06330.1 hypothetical protein [Diaminobutyricibacter tongyongensis]